MSNDTRSILLDKGIELLVEKGYTKTSIDDIVLATGIPKGSFHYWFKSKEVFTLQAVRHFTDIYSKKLDESLSDETRSPLDRIRHHYESAITHIENNGCRKGCLIGTLSQEMSAQSEVLRLSLEEIFTSWSNRLCVCLEQAQEQGEIAGEVNVRELAEFFVISWQGAILRTKRCEARLRCVFS